MSVLVWNQPGEKTYESGLDRGVFFRDNQDGFAWNGLVSVEKAVNGGSLDSYYFDGVKYLDFVTNEDFQATLSAYSTPSQFRECEGKKEIAAGLFATHQPRKTFGLSYRTGLGNDLEFDDYGYKIHLVWNATASPSPQSHISRSDSVNLNVRQWTIDCVPPITSTFKPTAHLEISSIDADPAVLVQIEEAIYGTAVTASQMPTLADVINIFQSA